MRRTLGYALLILGLTLIFLSPLLRWYAIPRVEKAPTDVYDRIVSDGFGRYLSTDTFSVTATRALQTIQIAKGNPAASTRGVAVVSFFQRTIDTLAHTDIDYQLDIYAFDRDTGEAVHCCGERPRHEGVTLKFPFHTQRRTYPLYDSMAHHAYPAIYERTEDVDGLKTYVFESHVPDTPTGRIDNFPGFLAGKPDEEAVTVFTHYTSDTTAWVEPVTGAIIKGAQHLVQWAVDKDGHYATTLSNTSFVYDGPTVRSHVDDIKPQAFQLVLVGAIVPVYGPVAGVALLVTGFLLLRRPARREPEEGTELEEA